MVCEAAERAMVHAEDAPRRAPSSVWPRWGRGFGAWKSPQGSLGGRRAASNLPTIIPEGTLIRLGEPKAISEDEAIDCSLGQ